MYCVKCQWWVECWFIFFIFSTWHLYSCKNDRFCYICSNVVLPNHQAKISDFIKKSYRDNFEINLGVQDKPFTSHICCKTCGELKGMVKERVCHLPMSWREGKDPIADSYFCMINPKEINHKNQHNDQYRNVSSAIRPIPHGPDLPVPEPDGNMEFQT